METLQEPKTLEEVTKDWLYKKYYTENLGVYEISLILKVIDTKLISAKLQEFEIPKKPKGRRKIETTTQSLNDEGVIVVAQKDVKFQINEEEFEVGDRFYTTQEIQTLRKDSLITVIDINKQGEIQIRDQYTHSKKFWINPSDNVLVPI